MAGHGRSPARTIHGRLGMVSSITLRGDDSWPVEDGHLRPKANLNTGPREEHVANHAGGRRGVVWECYHQRTQEAAHHGCMDQPRKSILAIHLWRGFMTYKPIDLGVHFPVKQMFIADNTKTMIGTLSMLPSPIYCIM